MFSTALTRVLAHEGEYSADPHDPGNWTGGRVGRGELRGTKWGISAAACPDLDIAALTQDQAAHLYRVRYWNPVHADHLPFAVAWQLFDYAVNSGVVTAVRAWQGVLNVTADGIIGPHTLKAARRVPTTTQVLGLLSQRLAFLTGLRHWSTQGRGWARRMARNIEWAALDLQP